MTSSSALRGQTYKQDYGTPSFFLTSLPKLSKHFNLDGAKNDPTFKWPSFTDDYANVNTLPFVDERLHRRSQEQMLLRGVVEGLDVSILST